jgi:hypothetical protein
MGLFIAFLASSHCKAFQGEEQGSSISVLVIVLPGDAAHQSHVSFDQVSNGQQFFAHAEKGRAKGVLSASMCSASSLGISSFPNEVALKVIQQTEVEAHFVIVEPYAAGKCGKVDGKKEE